MEIVVFILNPLVYDNILKKHLFTTFVRVDVAREQTNEEKHEMIINGYPSLLLTHSDNR